MPHATRFMHQLCADVLCSDSLTPAVAPLSVAVGLALVALAATEDTPTQREVCAVLGTKPDDEDVFARETQRVLDSLRKKQHGIDLHMVTALYCAGDVNAPYKARCASTFGAEISPLADRRVINAYIERNSGGMLCDVVKADPKGPMTAVNVLLFTGEWSTAFDDRKTEDAQFFAKNWWVSCRMMNACRVLGYRNIDGMHVVELPYGKADPDDADAADTPPFVAYFFLPPLDHSLDTFIRFYIGNADNFAHATNGLSYQEIDLFLPEFELESTTCLNEILMKTMPTAFGDTASFQRLSHTPGVYLDDVTHVAAIKVNAVGTRAAAATVVRVATRSSRPPGPPTVVFKYPFFFVVVHKPTNTIVFATAVKDIKPKNSCS